MLCQAIIILLLILLQGAADSVETAAYPEDFDALLETAHAGDVRAQVAAGIVYFYGREGGVDYREAIRWFGTAASDEDPIALYFLGAIHGAGYGAETDTARAREYYERSAPGLRRRAAEGDPDAMANLGLLFNLGVAIPAHPDSARHWVERAAEAGLPRAQYYAGFYARHGVGGERDPARAFRWFRHAAAGGHVRAQENLGNIYFLGEGHGANLDSARYWFRRAETYPAASEDTREGVYVYRGIPREGDQVIPGLLPPRSRLRIHEGDCGEACLWTLLRAWGVELTKVDINEIGTGSSRGLHCYELHRVLKNHGLDYRDTMWRPSLSFIPRFVRSFFKSSPVEERTALYRRFLYGEIIASVLRGVPVILAVKAVPETHALYPAEHFVLVVGYNPQTDEMIYNSHNRRNRFKASKLLDIIDTYSLVNRYDWTGALFVPLPAEGSRAPLQGPREKP